MSGDSSALNVGLPGIEHLPRGQKRKYSKTNFFTPSDATYRKYLLPLRRSCVIMWSGRQSGDSSQNGKTDMATEIKEGDFDATVLKAAKPVLVDFYATWCGPCMQQTPILEKWAAARQGQADVVKLNVDSAASVASTYGVMSIPTLIIFKGGKEVGRAVGLQSEKGLDALLSKAGG